MQKTALLIVDAQNEMFAESNPVYNANELLENLQTLIKKARSADIPVVYVQHNDGGLVKGTHDWEIHKSISPQDGDPVIQKWSPDSFHKTELQDQLKTKGIENLIITGNQTENCINATCRSAFDLGYKVTLAKDAHGTWDSDSLSAKQIIDHHNSEWSSIADLKETKDIEFAE